MEKSKTKAYEEGALDFQRRVFYAKNPYPVGSLEFTDWKQGCDDAYDVFLKSYSKVEDDK